MRLWIGGAYQGKLACLKGYLPLADIRFCSLEQPILDLSGRAVSGLHLWVKAALTAGLSPLEELRLRTSELHPQTILCDELGGGIVPLKREDRRWREETGKVIQFLSNCAAEVTIFFAGIPQRLRLRQTVTLLRHGVTADNLARRYCGTSDPPLCTQGREALIGRRYPPADRYFSSPSRRAVETLHLLFGEVKYTLCPELAECGFGIFEGHTHEELEGREDYKKWILDETGDMAPPGGESRNENRTRVLAAADELLQQDFDSAAVVCHGGTIVRMMEAWFPGAHCFYEWQPQNGEGWRILFENGKPVDFQKMIG